MTLSTAPAGGPAVRGDGSAVPVRPAGGRGRLVSLGEVPILAPTPGYPFPVRPADARHLCPGPSFATTEEQELRLSLDLKGEAQIVLASPARPSVLAEVDQLFDHRRARRIGTKDEHPRAARFIGGVEIQRLGAECPGQSLPVLADDERHPLTLQAGPDPLELLWGEGRLGPRAPPTPTEGLQHCPKVIPTPATHATDDRPFACSVRRRYVGEYTSEYR